YGQSGQPVTVHLATSLGWSQQQSRHFARITFNSGRPLWPACSSSRPRSRVSAPLRITKECIGQLLFREAAPLRSKANGVNAAVSFFTPCPGPLRRGRVFS